jgi:hypothetical protein
VCKLVGEHHSPDAISEWSRVGHLLTIVNLSARKVGCSLKTEWDADEKKAFNIAMDTLGFSRKQVADAAQGIPPLIAELTAVYG